MIRATAAIVGSGPTALALLERLQHSDSLEVAFLVGCDPTCPGLAEAARMGVKTSADGVYWLLDRTCQPVLLFDTTSARAHAAHAPLYAGAGIAALDLTSAAVGPLVCPPVNLHQHWDDPNVSLITSTSQATVPIAHAISQVVGVSQVEVVTGTADRFRARSHPRDPVTAHALRRLGGARTAGAAVRYHPSMMAGLDHHRISATIPPHADRYLIGMAIRKAVQQVRDYLPGYRLRAEPLFDEPHESRGGWAMVSVLLEVPGDAMVAAAAHVGERLVEKRLVTA